MGQVTVQPTGATRSGGFDLQGGPDVLTILTDASDSSYLQAATPNTEHVRLTYPPASVPAGAKLARARLRFRQYHDQFYDIDLWRITGGFFSVVPVQQNVISDEASAWTILQGAATDPDQFGSGNLRIELSTDGSGLTVRRLYRHLGLDLEYDERPVATITSPATSSSSTMTLRGTYADDLQPQDSWQFRILDGGTVVADSGRVYGDEAPEWQTPPVQNGVYTVELTVWQRFQVDHPSLPATQTLTVDAPVPAAPSITVAVDADGRQATVLVDGVDTGSVDVDIERRIPDGPWVRVASGVALDDGEATVVDRWVPLDIDVTYRARTVRYDAGLAYSGDWAVADSVTVPHPRMWERLVTDDVCLDLLITSWPDTRPMPVEVHRPLDEDRPIVDTGTSQGRDGTFAATLDTVEMDALDRIYRAGRTVLIKLERGETRWIVLTSFDRERLDTDLWEVTCETVEVAAPDVLVPPGPARVIAAGGGW